MFVCSFCGADQPKCKKLVAGPGIHICDRCVQQAGGILAGRKAAGAGDLVAVGPRQAGQCGFCGKDRAKVKHVVTTATQPPPPPKKGKYGTVGICNKCLLLCGEIVEQQAR